MSPARLYGFGFLCLTALVLIQCEADEEPWLIIEVPLEAVNASDWKLVVCGKDYEIETSVNVFTETCEGIAYLLNERTGSRSYGGYVTRGINSHVAIALRKDGSLAATWDGIVSYAPAEGSVNFADQTSVEGPIFGASPGTGSDAADGE